MQARPWQVEKLDWEGRKAFVRQTEADYYTDAIDYSRLKILEAFEQDRRARALCAQGEAHLVRRVAGYKKIRYYTHENVGFGQVNLPDQEMHTTAVWWRLDPAALEQAFRSRWQALDGFLGAAHALHWVAALLTLSELRDLGRAVGDSDAAWSAAVGFNGRGQARSLSGEPADLNDPAPRFQPTVFLYDNYPGGIGLSAVLFDLRDRVIGRARELIAACGCRHGCPACVGPILAVDADHSPKRAAIRVLELLASPPPS